MKKSILKIEGVQELSGKSLKSITGGHNYQCCMWDAQGNCTCYRVRYIAGSTPTPCNVHYGNAHCGFIEQ